MQQEKLQVITTYMYKQHANDAFDALVGMFENDEMTPEFAPGAARLIVMLGCTLDRLDEVHREILKQTQVAPSSSVSSLAQRAGVRS